MELENNKLKNRRLELGLTLEEVATIVGVAKSTVKKWETGFILNMKRDKIPLLAKALEVDTSFIIEGETLEDPRVQVLKKREKMQYDDFMNEAVLFFNDEKIQEEDKEKLILALQEVFFTAKLRRKNKNRKRG